MIDLSCMATLGGAKALITPRDLAGQRRLIDLAWDNETGALVWGEQRSDLGILLAGAGLDAPREIAPGHSVRACVGYGGGDLAAHGGHAFFVSAGQIHALKLSGGRPQRIAPPFGDCASPTVSPDGRWIVYVHSHEDTDLLAVVPSDGSQWPRKLIHGADFYMQPAWSPDGQWVAWVEWDHPYMPWERTRVCVGRFLAESGSCPQIVDARSVVDGTEGASSVQPVFSPDGRSLYYVSDISGWYGLYVYDLDRGTTEALWVDEAEMASPAWRQGMRTFAISPDGETLYVCRGKNSKVQLWALDIHSHGASLVDALTIYTHVSQPAVSPEGHVAMIASGPTIPARLVEWDPRSDNVRVRARSTGEIYGANDLTFPSHISLPTLDGELAFGLLYLPDCDAPDAAPPPLVIHIHGGPTGQSLVEYSGDAQLLTSHGYAVLELNYRGSSGYGRDYRRRLQGQWGILDAKDAVSALRHLSAQGIVDGERAAIMGGSAGGYTVLQCLVRYPGEFKAAICSYGVTDLGELARGTHKFEAHYLDGLVGPLPECSSRYRDRSPLFHADAIRDPVAVFQGQEDRVVPMAQAQAIVDALSRNGVPHEYHLYPNEGHGWRRNETRTHYYGAVLDFLERHLR